MPTQETDQPTEIPRELDRWNWGAFLLNWIWGIGNSTFVALLALIPVVNFVVMIVLGLRGSRWAWRNRVWRDVDHFRRTQRNWAIAGAIIWVIVIGAVVSPFASLPFMLRSSDAYEMTMESLRADERVIAALGEDFDTGWWINGQVSLQAGGSGVARFSLPVEGSEGSGTAVSHAVREDGAWSLRLVLVVVDGWEAPIVLVNEDDLAIPKDAINI